jgi:EpsG family
MIYVVIYILLCLLVPFGRIGGRRNTALLLFVSTVLFVFVGFRWQVGCDWGGYLNIFEITRQSSVEEAASGREPGFALLNVFLHNLGLDYFYVNVAGSFLFFLGLYLYARRQENPLAIVALSFPVLIVNMPMSGVRQGIAIGFLMIAINAYRDGRRWLYAGTVLAGATFHQSALIFLGLAPLIRLPKTVATVGFAIILTAPAVYYAATGAASFYVERYGESGAAAAGAPYRTALLALVGLAFFVILNKRWRQKFPDDYEITAIASALMIASLPLALYSSIMGDRFGYYLIPFQIVALERIAVLFKNDRMNPIYTAAPYVGLLVFFVLWIAYSPLFADCYLPYQNVLLWPE